MKKTDWINSYLQRMENGLRNVLGRYGLEAEIRIIHRDQTPLPEEDRARYEEYLDAIGEETLLEKIHGRSDIWTEEISHYEKLINALLDRLIGGDPQGRFIERISFVGIRNRTVRVTESIDALSDRMRDGLDRMSGEVSKSFDRMSGEMRDGFGRVSDEISGGVERITGDINAAYDSLTEGLAGVQNRVDELAEQQELFALRLDDIDQRLEGQIRDFAEEPEIEDLLKRKLDQIEALEALYPAVSFEENTRWLLLFVADRVLREDLPVFLREVADGAYKKDAFVKEKDAYKRETYFSLGPLGEYGVYKRDGKARIFHLELGEEVLGNGITAQFLATHPLSCGPRIFYDQAIFDEFRRLLDLATKSILIVSPWIRLGVLGFNVKKDDPTEADYRDVWGGGYYGRLKKAAERKVEIVFKYGICDASGTNSENQVKEEETERAAQKLRELLGAVVTLDHSNTHIKAAIIDEKVCLVGSCNLLSFHSRYRENSGDSKRHELMMEVRDPEIIRNLTAYIRDTAIVSDTLSERK